MQFLAGITQIITPILILISLILVIFLLCGILILIIQHHNYKTAKILIKNAERRLWEKHNIISFYVIITDKEKIPVITIKQKDSTTVQVADNSKQILEIAQVIHEVDNAKGSLTYEELEQIKKKLS